jgi:Gpi18-like mannosyltransferase
MLVASGSAMETENVVSRSWRKWFAAFKQICPIYIGVHLAFFVTSVLSVLFVHKDFDWSNSPTQTLWHSWNRWDTGNFITIAQKGYNQIILTAFFPLYPLLMRSLAHLFFHNYLIAGLFISNMALLVISVVLYQLVLEDFDQERASRTVLYLSVFPTAFFLASAYNESLFLCFALLSFYQMRHGRWWMAGLFGILASLTRSAGLFLILPFCYEYLQQRQFRLKAIRLDIVSMALIPAGIGIFALFCYKQFGDPLAFSHAQSAAGWSRHLEPPWMGMFWSIHAIQSSAGILSFQALRNLTDLLPDLLFSMLLVLTVIGPWRFPRKYWSYSLYGIALYLFFNLVPGKGNELYSLTSMSRFMLELFPGFILLATLGKYRTVHMCYLMVSAAVLFFLLTQFLTGHWVL